MSSLADYSEQNAPAAATQHKCLVVGAGPAGMRAAQELAKRGQSVRVLSAEAVPPYNRVRLTPLLGGDVQFGEILLQEVEPDTSDYELCLGQRVVSIQREAKEVILSLIHI